MPITFPRPSPSLEAAEHPRIGAVPNALKGPEHGEESSRAAEGPEPNPVGPQPAEKSTLPPSAGSVEPMKGME